VPLRGETIGTAYVRVLADGTGFDEDLRRQLRNSESQFEEIGRDHGADYRRGFSDEMEKVGSEDSETVMEAFQRGRGRWNAEGRIMGGEAGEGILDGIKEQIERDHGDVGLVVIKNLNEALQSGQIDYTGLTNRLANLRPDLAKATRQIVDDQERMWNELGGSVERYTQGIERGVGTRADLRKELVRLRERMVQIQGPSADLTARFRELHRNISRATPVLSRFSGVIKGSGDWTGRLFGRGSRNDFVNFFGGFMSILPRAGAAILGFVATAKAGLAGFAGEVKMRMDEGSKGFQAFIQTLGGVASTGLPGLIALAAAIALAITTLSVTLPALGAAVSLATGLILALAGSLGFALVGALGAVAGAMVPFAAALGVGALAISGISKEMKKTDGFKSMKKEWKELQSIAAEGIFGKDGSGFEVISGVLTSLEPIVKTVSAALGGLLKQFGDFAETKGFKDLITGITAALGPMVTLLGQIGGKLLLGLGQAFIALSPIISELLGWLDGLMTKFVELGKGGSSSDLAGFFNKAWDSAKVLFDLIGSIGSLIATIFGSGQPYGDKMFGDIAAKVKEIVGWLTSPEGQKALDQWFQDAQRLGEKLGEIVVSVVEFIDALDTPVSRQLLMDILGIINGIIGALTDAVGVLTWWLEVCQKIQNFWRTVGATIKAVFLGFPDWINGAARALNEWVDNFDPAPAIEAAFTALGTWIKGLFTDLGTWISEQWANTFGAFHWPDMSGFLDPIKKPFIDLYNWLVGNSLIPDLINAIIGWFFKLPTAIAQAIADTVVAFGTWIIGMVAKAAEVVGKIAAAFIGLAAKLFTQAGDAAAAAWTWIKGMAGKAAQIVTDIIGKFIGLAGKIFSKAGDFAKAAKNWLAGGPPAADATADKMADQFSGLASASMKEAGSLSGAVSDWGQGGVKEAHRVAQGIVNQFDGLDKDIERAIGKVTVTVDVIIPEIKRPRVKAIITDPRNGDVIASAAGAVAGLARGSITHGPMLSWIGEAGPEAVVPLNRSLSQVDPSVRALSAFAQGLDIPGKPSKEKPTMNVTIVTPTKDPAAVAAEVFARVVAGSYI